MGYGPAAGRGLQTSTPVRGTLNGRWDEGCLTGPVILGTFRTPEGFAVIKSELIDRISVQNPHLYRQDAEKIVNTIFSEITAAMARSDRVELRGFGVFFVRVREGRTGRNPRTGALVSVGSKAVPLFRSGKEMKSLLNYMRTPTIPTRPPDRDPNIDYF
jgi:integration host factor subunit beta